LYSNYYLHIFCDYSAVQRFSAKKTDISFFLQQRLPFPKGCARMSLKGGGTYEDRKKCSYKTGKGLCGKSSAAGCQPYNLRMALSAENTRRAGSFPQAQGMITALGDWLARKLALSGAVPEGERELYSYGFFLLLSKGLFLVVTAAFGAMWGGLWESIAFYGLFALLRGYAGGIHASRESTCLFWTTAAMLLSTGLIRWMEAPGREAVALGLLLAGLIGVALLSPLDSPEKPLAPEDWGLYRWRSLVAALGVAGGSLVSAALGWPVPLAIAAPALALEALLLAIGTVKTRKSAKMQK